MLHEYLVDGSSLSIADRGKLIDVLDKYAYTGTIFVDMKKGIYHAFFEENAVLSAIPFPDGTILKLLY